MTMTLKMHSKPIPYSLDAEDIGLLNTAVAEQGPECKVGINSMGSPPRHQTKCLPIGTRQGRTVYQCPDCGTVCFGTGAYGRP